ncbi:hypothetical protein JG676_04540 [Campylobacter sp. 2018MI35]|uniref:hypothetical protein n=1 Tax=Campylobacter sp. 2018MI34 TaxID=2800582 RepID=UPI001904E909|nr:hypothetical protein [Campylobacter sp. 2018MI34]MBK1991868.1 hypothetical protein [Campylobacter sp. 2018MI34]
MKISLFIFASFVYIIFIMLFLFYLDLGTYTLNIFHYSMELPVMTWFALVLVIFIIFTILHISFYSFLNYLKFKHFLKDSNKFESFIIDLLLEKETKINFQTKEFRQVANLVKTLKTHQKDKLNSKINDILDLIDSIKRGEYCNLNKFKLEKNNILFLQNEKNHIKNDINYTYNKIKYAEQIEDELTEYAFDTLIKKGTYEQIKNIKINKNQEQILTIINRFKNQELKLNLAEFEVLIDRPDLNEKEYLQIAKSSTKSLSPDAILNIFKKIKDKNNEALRAYLYLLANFSMFDELLSEIRNDEKRFSDFSNILLLREHHKKFDLDKLII